VRNNAAGGYISAAELDLVKHVQVIENIFERAVVRETVEKVTNCVFSVHWSLQARASSRGKIPDSGQLAKAHIRYRPHNVHFG
jgi:hypothetical protein